MTGSAKREERKKEKTGARGSRKSKTRMRGAKHDQTRANPTYAPTTMSSIKGLPQSQSSFDGAPLRVAIVHARWNKTVIDALVAGAVKKLKAHGVKDHNIVVQTVPGSFELPLACQRYADLPVASSSSVINQRENHARVVPTESSRDLMSRPARPRRISSAASAGCP